MRKMTLLEMTQNILSAMDSDEVNSITDTVESLQVAEIIKETFYEQFNNIHVPEFNTLFQFESVNDVTRPNYLRIPEHIAKVNWVKYRDLDSGILQDLMYVTPEEFLNTQLNLSTGNGLQLVVDPTGIEYVIETVRGPTRYTIFDDRYLVTDAYDLEYEGVLQSINTLGYGIKSSQFQMEDDYIPPIDGNLFPLLLAEAKSVAFINLKQVSSSKEEQRARRQRIRMQNDQFRGRADQYAYWNRGPNYSRYR